MSAEGWVAVGAGYRRVVGPFVLGVWPAPSTDTAPFHAWIATTANPYSGSSGLPTKDGFGSLAEAQEWIKTEARKLAEGILSDLGAQKGGPPGDRSPAGLVQWTNNNGT